MPMASLALAQEVPTFALEITYSVFDLERGILLANDLEDHVVLLADLNDCLTQRLEINHAGADRVVAPRLQTGVGDVDERDRGMEGKEGSDRILLYEGG